MFLHDIFITTFTVIVVMLKTLLLLIVFLEILNLINVARQNKCFFVQRMQQLLLENRRSSEDTLTVSDLSLWLKLTRLLVFPCVYFLLGVLIFNFFLNRFCCLLLIMITVFIWVLCVCTKHSQKSFIVYIIMCIVFNM